ncbi:MAG: AAA family ATPase [Candidatus Riflebacteria bacterium]|nr:AAA family ATPase [Candidatus Riflebacteria bacterium]
MKPAASEDVSKSQVSDVSDAASSRTTTLISPEQLRPSCEIVARLLRELDSQLLGRPELHRLVVVAILSRGHILLEGVPGVGKTALVKVLCQLLQLDGKRVQFTPDLMPGDILGTHILQQRSDGNREMVFQQGPIFTNLLLADEINRASPKTQSALLEAMQERSVTLLGNTRQLPDPFFVLASQNPIEMEGTYPLPEAQLDRFLFKLSVDSPDAAVLEQIIAGRRRGEIPTPDFILSADQLKDLFGIMERIFLPKAVARYIARLTAATHPNTPEAPPIIKRSISYGASPRAAIALAEAARAMALLDGRPTVGFSDVRMVAEAVLNHRIIINYQARFEGLTPKAIIADLLRHVEETGLKLPPDVSVS